MSEMKKDKKWLLHEFRKLPCEVQRGHGKVKVVDILPLIDQLDEPEKVVVPQFVAEVFEKVKGSNIYAGQIISAMYESSDEVSYWLEVPSNEKLLLRAWLNGYEVKELPVIPQFVADWWERDGDSVTMYGRLRVEKKHKFDLISIFYDKGLGDYLSKVEDWLDENDSAFLDLVNGKPYEVEKEKLYYIKFSENQYAQRFDESKIDSILVNDKVIAGRFTKEEIEKMNSNFMALAAEVTE